MTGPAWHWLKCTTCNDILERSQGHEVTFPETQWNPSAPRGFPQENNSRLVSAKASTARSSSSHECAAETGRGPALHDRVEKADPVNAFFEHARGEFRERAASPSMIGTIGWLPGLIVNPSLVRAARKCRGRICCNGEACGLGGLVPGRIKFVQSPGDRNVYRVVFAEVHFQAGIAG